MSKTPSGMTRRHMITITAGFAGLGASIPARGNAGVSVDPSIVHEWRGIALGAQTSIKLAHEDREEAVRILAHCRSEVDRLESIFSLYRPGSEINRLNESGVLMRPSHDMRQCLGAARRYSDITSGAFDISVGPLWDAYAGADVSMNEQLSDEDRASVLTKVDYRAIDLDAGHIAFEKTGMAITLNGIAQGYITDRIASLLDEYGFSQALVCLGEMYALEAPDDGRPWAIRIDGLTGANAEISLENAALATSSAKGTVFSSDASQTGASQSGSVLSHLVNPHTGRASPLWEQVSVVAPNATCADALSTGLSFVERSAWSGMIERAGADYAVGLGADGQDFAIARSSMRSSSLKIKI